VGADVRPRPGRGLEAAPPAREHEEKEIHRRAVLPGEPLPSLELAFQKGKVALRLRRCEVADALGAVPLGIEEAEERCLNRVGQEDEPTVELRSLAGRQARSRKAVGQVEQDRGGLGHDHGAVDERRDDAERVEREVLRVGLRGVAFDPYELIGHADLRQGRVRRHRRRAGTPVEAQRLHLS
jgi:hypothetical protein